MRRRTFVLSALAVALGGAATAAPSERSLRRAVRAAFAPALARRDFAGVVAVQADGAAPLIESFALADDGPAAGAAQALYGIESISKLFTLEGLRALQEAGRLSYDDALERWLPGFANGTAITLRMLAQHNAGLARELAPAALDRTRPHTTAELAEACRAMAPAAPPGSGFGYSNNGYRVLARVLELAGDAPFDELIRARVLAPRGMLSTLEADAAARGRLAPARVPGPGWDTLAAPPPVDLSNWRGAASYASTAEDLLRFAASLEPAAANPAPRTAIGHDGRGHGYLALCFRYPAERTSIVVLGRVESGVFDDLKRTLEQLVFDGATPRLELAEYRRGPGAIDPGMLGSYDLYGTPLLVGRDAGGGYFVDAGDGPQPLIAIGANTLFSRLHYATLRGAAGAPLDWSEGSARWRLSRR